MSCVPPLCLSFEGGSVGRGEPDIRILSSRRSGWGDSLDTDPCVFRMGGVGDEDAEVFVYIHFLFAR